MVQPALQDEPRRTRGVLGPSLAETRPKTDPTNSGQTAFKANLAPRGPSKASDPTAPTPVSPRRRQPFTRGFGPKPAQIGGPLAASSSWALLISVFCCVGPFCGRGRPHDLVERVGFEISCRNQGSLPSGIGSKAILGVGDRPGGPSCVIRKTVFVFPSGP